MSLRNAKIERRQTVSPQERAAAEAAEAIRRMAERRERVALSSVAFVNGWTGDFRVLSFDLGAARICVAFGTLDASAPAANVKIADLARDFRPAADVLLPAVGLTGAVKSARYLEITAGGVISASDLNDDTYHVSGVWLAGR